MKLDDTHTELRLTLICGRFFAGARVGIFFVPVNCSGRDRNCQLKWRLMEWMLSGQSRVRLATTRTICFNFRNLLSEICSNSSCVLQQGNDVLANHPRIYTSTRTRPVQPPNAPFLRRCSPPQNCTSWAWRTKSIARECRRDRSRERRACTNSGSTARCCGNFQNGHPPNSSVLYIRREEKFWGWISSRVGAEVGGVGRCRRPAVGENSKSGEKCNPSV